MSFSAIQERYGYTEKDYLYSRTYLSSGYDRNKILFMVPIKLPYAVIGGFLLKDVLIFSTFNVMPKSKWAHDNVNNVYKSLLNSSSNNKYNSGSIENTFRDDFYIDAFERVFKACTVVNGATIDNYNTYLNVIGNFSLNPVNTIRPLLGMDILYYFDMIITQPRYEILSDSKQIYSISRKKLGDITAPGKLYFSIPDSTLSNSELFSITNPIDDIETEFPFYSVYDIDSLDYSKSTNEYNVASEFLNSDFSNAKLPYRTSSKEDIFNSLSQNSIEIVVDDIDKSNYKNTLNRIVTVKPLHFGDR